MSEIATLANNHTLQLPITIAEHFKPADRFLVWVEGDTMHLKRLTPSVVSIVEQAPEGEPMPLDEINELVHEVRRRRSEREQG